MAVSWEDALDFIASNMVKKQGKDMVGIVGSLADAEVFELNSHRQSALMQFFRLPLH